MSLRARILLLVLLASLLPVIVMIRLLFDIHDTTVLQERERLVSRVEDIANELDDKIAGTAQLLFGLSRVPVVAGDDRTACSDFLADVLKEHPQYTGILTIKPDGFLHCDSLRSGRRLDLNDRKYFQMAKQAHGPVIEPVIGRLTGKGVLQIAYPVRDAKGVLLFVMLASLDMDIFGRSVADALPFPGMNFQVWNNDGTIILDSPGKQAKKFAVGAEERAFVLSGDIKGTAILSQKVTPRVWAKTSLKPGTNVGLHVVLGVAETDLKARFDQQFRQTLMLLAALAILTALAGVILAEVSVRRQTTRLMRTIARIDAGQFEQSDTASFPRGELGQVMRALARMAASLLQQRQEIARYTEALEHQARTDALTGLASRHLLDDRLEQAIIYARRSGRIAAVLMLDLDRFKTINDSLGHGRGDALLKVLAGRLQACVREGDTVARLGGDEFVVVLSDMAEAEDIVPIAQNILHALALPVSVEQLELMVSVSIGIAVFPRDAEKPETLIQYADAAMYRAKEQGGNVMAFFASAMMDAITKRLQMEAGLRGALEKGELRLYFQPIIDARSGRVTSAEALIRWQDPQRGLVSPMDFIPVAEETGLIIPIGNWVLNEACRQARAWRDLGLGDIPIAVNLSARQFAVPQLDKVVEEALRSSQCPATLLQLEITESCIMERVDDALAIMYKLTALGIKFAIDDFGTGYSSLSQLKRFPVSKLKIDRSFVRDIGVDENDDVLIDAILTLAQKLELRTVAEGVETVSQIAFLETRGCDEYQGYFYGKPCTAEEFTRLVVERNQQVPSI